jgi:uncharacterized membrane protein YraQ (UPF0718 family)
MTFLSAWWDALWALMHESGLWLIVGFAMAGAVHALIPRSFLTRHLAGPGPWPILKASLLGIPLPLCSCSVIPVAAGLRKDGASKGASAAFAISTPQTGEESIPLTWALFGPVFALARPLIAVTTAFIAGILIQFTDRKQTAARTITISEQPFKPAACCGTKPAPASPPKTCCQSQPQPSRLAPRLRDAWRHAFVTMPMDLAPWLFVGFLAAAAITAALPPGWIASHVGTGLLPMLAMLLVGIPLYVCATSSTPLAYSLVLAGLSPGAALVLLLAGPATNIATVTWALKDLGLRATAIYLATIASVAVAAGLAFDTLFADSIQLARDLGTHEHVALGAAFAIGSVLFSMLLGWCLTMRLWNALPAARACSVDSTQHSCCHAQDSEHTP